MLYLYSSNSSQCYLLHLSHPAQGSNASTCDLFGLDTLRHHLCRQCRLLCLWQELKCIYISTFQGYSLKSVPLLRRLHKPPSQFIVVCYGSFSILWSIMHLSIEKTPFNAVGGEDWRQRRHTGNSSWLVEYPNRRTAVCEICVGRKCYSHNTVHTNRHSEMLWKWPQVTCLLQDQQTW